MNPFSRLRSTLRRARRLLWGRRADHGALREVALLPVRLVLLTGDGFHRNNLASQASALAFYTLLALVPFLAFLFLLLKVFQIPSMVRPLVLNLVAGGNEVLVERISEFIENAQGAGLGGVGIVTSFGMGFVVLQRVKKTLNMIWEVRKRPGFAYRMIEYMAVLTVAPVLLAASLGITTVLSGTQVQRAISELYLLGDVYVNAAAVSSYVVVWLLVLYAFAYFPETHVRWYAALVGALVTGATLNVAQNFYVEAVLWVSDYNMIYGALAFLPLLMVWFYLGWVLFLFGAQLSCAVQYYPVFLERQRHRAGSAQRSAEPFMALRLLVALLRWFHEYGKPAPLLTIARHQHLPRHMAQELARKLSSAGLLTAVEGEPHAYVPRERIEGVTVRDVLFRMNLMPGFGEPIPDGTDHGESEGLLAALRKANLALAVPLEELPLTELVRRLPSATESRGAAPGAAEAPQPAEG